MKHFLLAVLILLLPSCSSTFFFSRLNTPNEYVEKVDNGDFLLETDSLWIAYCFKGANGPVQITVFNKSDKPLYVDWEKSALIIDKMAMTYAGEKIDYSGKWEGAIVNDSYALGSFEGSIPLQKNVSFVPPQTMVSEIPLVLSPTFGHIDKKSYRDARIADKNAKSISIKKIDFDESNSPLSFKSYLTVYFQPEKPMTFEQDFYLSTLMKTNQMSPSDFLPEMIDSGDFFYVEKPANTKALYTTLGIIAGTGLIVVGVIYGEPENIDYDYGDDWW